jgi:hypothetical protein
MSDVTDVAPEGFMDFSFLGKRKSWDVPTPADFIIRVSTVIDQELCQGRSIIPALLKWPSFPPNEPMMFGTVAHALIEAEIAGKPIPYVPDLVKAALILDGITGYEPAYVNQKFITSVLIARNKWVEQVMPGLEYEAGPYWVEARLHRPLGMVDGKPVWLRGTSDLATPTIIIDWKTAGKAWRKGRAEKSIQLPLYRSLVEWNHEVAPDLGSYVVYNRDKKEWNSHLVPLTNDKVNGALLRAFVQARAAVRQEYTLSPAGDFQERAWYCKPAFCNAWDACPLGGGKLWE